MNIALLKPSLVERDKDGKAIYIKGQPVSSIRNTLTIVDTEVRSGPDCEESFCAEYSICPACGRGIREYGEVNLTAGVVTFRLPCTTAVHDAISSAVAELCREEYDVEIERVAAVPTDLVDRAELKFSEEDDEDDGPEIIIP